MEMDVLMEANICGLKNKHQTSLTFLQMSLLDEAENIDPHV